MIQLLTHLTHDGLVGMGERWDKVWIFCKKQYRCCFGSRGAAAWPVGHYVAG